MSKGASPLISKQLSTQISAMMGDLSKPEGPLVPLQSKDHGDLLNIIDDLRSQGIGHYVDLPQLIVCGDQSSGKSSVLEAVSNIRFPTKDALCTRFATELILRREPRNTGTTINVMIIPGRDRKDDAVLADLKRFQRNNIQLSEFEDLVNDAKKVMGIDDLGKSFSSDILRVEASGPDLPHLTLVDLPGLFSASSKSQSDDDVEVVRDLVISYMKKPRSIILAVVTAKNDFNNQIVTKYSREWDPSGSRTLGIITKPDTLPAGSDSERSFIELAENKDVQFRLGWHVLRNRDYETKESSSEERDEAEAKFFSEGNWASLPSSQVAVASLKPRLSKMLKNQILKELPELIRDVEKGINESQGILDRLGGARATTKEQRDHLLQISEKFTELVKAAVGGFYHDKFFGSAMADEGFNKRLRAIVKTILSQFSDEMWKRGHAKRIVDDNRPALRRDGMPPHVTRTAFIKEVNVLMERNAGRELPGTYNPLIIGVLFFEHSIPWEHLMRQCMANVVKSTRTCVNLVLEHIADEETIAGLMRDIINPKINALISATEQKASEILRPNQEGQPSTYNHYFIDNVQKAKERHWTKFLEERVCEHFQVCNLQERYDTPDNGIQLQGLVDRLSSGRTETDMNNFACSEAIDCMLAYYKVARKTFVDNFSELAVEQCLLRQLATILTPKVVYDLETSEISKIAAESEENQEERERATEKLRVLSKTLEVLHGLDRHQGPAREKVQKPVTSDEKENSLASNASVVAVNGDEDSDGFSS